MWIAIVLVLVVSVGCVCAFAAVKGKQIKGSGNIVTKSVSVGTFDAVEASRAVKVVFVDRPQGEVLIEADDNLMEYVVVRVHENELLIGFDKLAGNISNVHVTVTVPADPAIRSLEASSAAVILCPMPLTADGVALEVSSAGRIEAVVQAETCKIEASSAARISADVTAKECSVKASSAAGIELKGKAMSCQADLSSAAKLDAEEFVVGAYGIDVSSAAKASVNCLATLNANASSGAKISYKGDCAGVQHVSSGGRITKE